MSEQRSYGGLGDNVFILVGIDLNASGAGKDNPLVIPYIKYIARRITVTDASVSLAASPATLGLFTAPNGGGITVVPFTTLTSLNTSTKFGEIAFTFTNYSTIQTVYVRNGTPHGSPATVNLYLEITPLQ